ncbi:Hypothetical protein, putative [Bodo saltans]|uniref:Uncharacterized protein n=1 Tax=Bodo saltans TaxID=75058 RepID=A0A0S4JGJ2_BODSA|nr:Hypothetical protein, putative [Bodo saltans]|eukprot:CUG90675.1 Hypothetical protein, putative [Bodo saltans]
MRNTAIWAIEEKRRRKNDLSAAAEDHCERLHRAFHKANAAPNPTSSTDRRLDHTYVARSPRTVVAPVNLSLSTSVFSDMMPSTPNFHQSLVSLLMEELHQRASLQLFEATQYSGQVLQPFATSMMVCALRYELERDEALLQRDIVTRGDDPK